MTPREMAAQLALWRVAMRGLRPDALPPLPARPLVDGPGYDRMWDQIEARYARTEGTALWHEEAIAETIKQERRREMEQREREARERVRHLHGVGDKLGRASAYLSRIDGGISGQGRNTAAWGAVLIVVRGFALEEEEAVALIDGEYAPRCQPRLPTRDVRGMVRRARRAGRPPWGAFLIESANRAR